MTNWYQQSVDEVIANCDTDPDKGLSAEEAQRRLSQFGPNELEEQQGRSPWLIFLRQFAEPLVILLIVAAIVAALIGEVVDSLFIAFILVANAIIGFVQEHRAERAVAALRKMAAPHARVIRDGQVKDIPAREVVPGDIVLLEAGMRVVADLRLVQTSNLQIDEAALTGESFPVSKQAAAQLPEETVVGDRTNMAFASTLVTYGRGQGVVAETGMGTQMGQIAALLQTTEAGKTPLQIRMAQAGKWLIAATLLICAVVFMGGWLRGEKITDMFLTAVSLAVAAVPEGLPAVVTITLALGAQQMVRRQALIRRLPAVETLGSVTVICSDKTGTLTQGTMSVQVLSANRSLVTVAESEDGLRADFQSNGEALAVSEEPHFSLLLRSSSLCTDARIQQPCTPEETATGDPTEIALVKVAAQAGLVKGELETEYPRIDEIPFESARKRMTTLHRVPEYESPSAGPQPAQSGGEVGELRLRDKAQTAGEFVSYTKGALEMVLAGCRFILRDNQVQPLSDADKAEIISQQEQLAAQGLRVLAAAYRLWEEAPAMEADSVEQEMVFIGFAGMSDPPRPEAQPAVQTCKQAGIVPVMITGDHAATAANIAQQLGILAEGQQTMTGQQLATTSVAALEAQVDDVSVYARVSPKDKVNIVEAWQNRGQIVAMTGDGVNDAPALKRADIGVAMGISGTDVSKEASDMILLDDNFATIVAAVERGRVIYDNIRKFFRYMLGTNAGEILTMFGSILLGWPLPLLPAQILWINLVTDGLPALALGVEPPEPGVMKRPPRDPNESVFARGMGPFILWVGVYMAICALGLFSYVFRNVHGLTGDVMQAEKAARTACFAVLAFLQMANVLAVRSETESVFRIGFWGNRQLIGAVVLTIVMQFAVTYMPWLQSILHTTALSAAHMGLCVGLASTLFFAVEIEKALRRRRGAVAPAEEA